MTLFQQALVYGSIAIVAGAAATFAELMRPAQPMTYKKVFLRDTAAFILYIAAIVPLADLFAGYVAPHIQFRWPVARLPLFARLILYYLVADFGSYVLHRLMHTKLLWRIHKWHHAPTYMYWFAGVRASLPQQFLFNLPAILAVPILAGGPGVHTPMWVYLALPAEVIFRNDWMHMNVRWRSNWLEWFLVTPRYHHIHHSDDQPRHAGNYGSLFTMWDRIFRTRIDPDTITAPLTYGTGEQDNAIRVIVGV